MLNVEDIFFMCVNCILIVLEAGEEKQEMRQGMTEKEDT